MSMPLTLVFPVSEYRKMETRPGLTISHFYPTVFDWPAREIPSEINPRSQDALNPTKAKSLRKAIAQTIEESPELFEVTNRGIAVIARSCVYDHKSGTVRIVIDDPEQQGVFDGGTTDAVLKAVKEKILKEKTDHNLFRARVHVEVIVCNNLIEDDRLKITAARNTSVQVTSWSLADLGGKFDWIKETLSDTNYAERIGYDQYAEKDTDVREVLALLTLFHPDIRPTQAYSARGVLDKKMANDKWAAGYKALQTVLTEIIDLHDHIYRTFPLRYQEAFQGGRLGARGKGEDRYFIKRNHTLPLTGEKAEYTVHAGVLYPVLGAMKVLIEYQNGNARFTVPPKDFFDQFGTGLVEAVSNELAKMNPTALGKAANVYTTLSSIANSAWQRIRAERAEAQLRALQLQRA